MENNENNNKIASEAKEPNDAVLQELKTLNQNVKSLQATVKSLLEVIYRSTDYLADLMIEPTRFNRSVRSPNYDSTIEKILQKNKNQENPRDK